MSLQTHLTSVPAGLAIYKKRPLLLVFLSAKEDRGLTKNLIGLSGLLQHPRLSGSLQLDAQQKAWETLNKLLFLRSHLCILGYTQLNFYTHKIVLQPNICKGCMYPGKSK